LIMISLMVYLKGRLDIDIKYQLKG
jgi:hypothetical protein